VAYSIAHKVHTLVAYLKPYNKESNNQHHGWGKPSDSHDPIIRQFFKPNRTKSLWFWEDEPSNR
jgi:hypothetical protein